MRCRPGAAATLNIERQDGRRESLPLLVRIDTPSEVAYFSAGGILPYVLEQLIGAGHDVIREDQAPGAHAPA
jgi:aconitate hydratase